MKKPTIIHFFFCLALLVLAPGRKKAMDIEKTSLQGKIERERVCLEKQEKEYIQGMESIKDNELDRAAAHEAMNAGKIDKTEYHRLENTYILWHQAAVMAILALYNKIESCKRNIERWEQKIQQIDSDAAKDLWRRFAVLIALAGGLWKLFG